MPEHPLGLRPDDVVLGYDGKPWEHLYRELLQAELPLYLGSTSIGGDPPGWSRSICGTVTEAYEYGWLRSAGLNWHFFQKLHVIRVTTGEEEAISVAPLAAAEMPIRCTDQLPVPGAPMPVPAWYEGVYEPDAGTWVSSGIVEGTRVGYVYVWSWYWGRVRDDFRQAIEAFSSDPSIEGLILDFRFNHGGIPAFADGGFELLFNERIQTVEVVERQDPKDRYALVSALPVVGPLEIQGDPATYFDRPIAVLTGPGAYSAGDFNALRVRYHPRVRTFGKLTSGAFTPAKPVRLPDDFHAAVAFLNTRRVDAPGELLVHSAQHLDEAVWLRQEDVVRGEDTVVRRALVWIEAISAGTDDEVQAPPFALSPVTPNPVSAAGLLRLSQPSSLEVRVAVYDVLGREVVVLHEGPLLPGRHAMRIAASDFASGLFIVHARSGTLSATQRIVVVH